MQQALNPLGHEACLPAPDGRLAFTGLPLDRHRADPVRAKQHNPGPPHMLLRAVPRADHRLQPLPVARTSRTSIPFLIRPDSHRRQPAGIIRQRRSTNRVSYHSQAGTWRCAIEGRAAPPDERAVLTVKPSRANRAPTCPAAVDRGTRGCRGDKRRGAARTGLPLRSTVGQAMITRATLIKDPHAIAELDRHHTRDCCHCRSGGLPCHLHGISFVNHRRA